MKPQNLESLLTRGRPSAPPNGLRERVLAAAQKRCRPGVLTTPPSRTQLLGVFTVAASILALLSTVLWMVRIPAPVRGPGGDAQNSGQPFEERRIAQEAGEERLSGFTWSADGKHWAYITMRIPPSGIAVHTVVVDGKRSPEYGWAGPPSFGEDGHYVHLARIGGETGQTLILDGVPLRTYGATMDFAFSPNGKKLAYVGRKGQQATVVVDGKPGEFFDEARSLLWSPDGRLAYAARVKQEWFVVLDGVKEEAFDEVNYLAFSPDGKSLAYRAREGKYLMVVDGKKSAEFAEVGSPVWGPGGLLAYGVGKETNTPLNTVTKYWVMAGRWPDLHPGVTHDEFDQVGPPVFSGDGKSWAYRARLRNREAIVQGTLEKDIQDTGEEFDSVSNPLVGPDRHSVVFVAGKGSQKYMVVGGTLTRKFSLIDQVSLRGDGKAVAYRAGHYGKQLVVAGDAQSQDFEEVLSGPVWSADGTKVAFTARVGTEIWSKVMDAK